VEVETSLICFFGSHGIVSRMRKKARDTAFVASILWFDWELAIETDSHLHSISLQN
jgi:hypothetical protein